MDNVPVKIAERYKPPPLVYQLPQSIVNKLALSSNYYNETTQFNYDFQLEKSVLGKMHCWRQMRQEERDTRLNRIERRRVENLRAIEMHQKEMLGAVNYPSAEELSSSSENETEGKDIEYDESPAKSESSTKIEQMSINSSSNFYNILQPTILSQRVSKNDYNVQTTNAESAIGAGKSAKALFNYADFEYDNSSPFDNMELKTINDLDMLAQVLHNTQQREKDIVRVEAENPIPVLREEIPRKSTEEGGAARTESVTTENLAALKETKVNLKEADFHNFNQSINKDIPVTNINSESSVQVSATSFRKNYNICSMHSSQTYNYQQQQNAASTYCNGHNANYEQLGTPVHTYAAQNQMTYQEPSNTEAVLKSRSVPNMLNELNQDVINSELRRSKNLVHNLNNEQQQQQRIKEAEHETDEDRAQTMKLWQTPAYDELEKSNKILAARISSMGFPLERVTKFVRIFGGDDKRIIEHLIPLNELMDLGFDESKISEALLRCDNNKEKALEYLIS